MVGETYKPISANHISWHQNFTKLKHTYVMLS